MLAIAPNASDRQYADDAPEEPLAPDGNPPRRATAVKDRNISLKTLRLVEFDGFAEPGKSISPTTRRRAASTKDKSQLSRTKTGRKTNACSWSSEGLEVSVSDDKVSVEGRPILSSALTTPGASVVTSRRSPASPNPNLDVVRRKNETQSKYRKYTNAVAACSL